MKRMLIVLAIALAGCPEPPKVNRCVGAVQDLEDCWKWDNARGAEGPGDPYQALVAADPTDSVPLLVSGLTNSKKTKIDDRIHEIPTVGDLCFHILMAVFQKSAKEFDRDGVYVIEHEELAIYAIVITKPETRVRLQQRFAKLAKERGWAGEK